MSVKKIIGLSEPTITESRHFPIEDGDIIVLTVAESADKGLVDFAKHVCQQLRDELLSAGKTITTVILPDSIQLETASRASIQELFARLGMALNPEPASAPGEET